MSQNSFPVDDLGTGIAVTHPVRRVVSLVPSLTESVASVNRAALIGATQWCTYPQDLDITRIRGTKNPDLATIIALQPDIVLANKEENRQVDVERLREAGVPVWVTDIETVAQALVSLHRLFQEALGWEIPQWLDQARECWSVSAPVPQRRVVIPIWRDPWMVVGSATFTADLARHLGLANVFATSSQRYPRTELSEILDADPELIVLPDEPYHFTSSDGPECFGSVPVRLVSGRLLTWYGPSLTQARELLEPLLRS